MKKSKEGNAEQGDISEESTAEGDVVFQLLAALTESKVSVVTKAIPEVSISLHARCLQVAQKNPEPLNAVWNTDVTAKVDDPPMANKSVGSSAYPSSSSPLLG